MEVLFIGKESEIEKVKEVLCRHKITGYFANDFIKLIACADMLSTIFDLGLFDLWVINNGRNAKLH